MATRSAPIVAAVALIGLLTAACGGTPPTSSPIPSVAPEPSIGASSPTPAVQPSPVPSPAETPIVGGVDGSQDGPQLSIVTVDHDTIVATIRDPAAKAWRISVAGTGALGGDRWDIVVETGDVGPVISATQVQDGRITDVMDLTGFMDRTTAAGGCHATLPVCLDSTGFTIPEGKHRFSVRLELPEGQVPLVIRGASAAWDGEPFILGPWHETEAFPWGEG
jgi:hypothetical protein